MRRGEFYLWQVRPFTVRVSLDLIEQLNAIIADPRRHRDEEMGGILLGVVREPHVVEVNGFQFIPSEHHRGTIFALGLREQFRVSQRVASLNKHSLRAVGFFRTHNRPGLFLDQDDFALMQDAFSGPSQIALLVKPLDPKPSNAGIFFWQDSELDRRGSALLFPFDAETLRAQGPIEVQPEPVRTPQPRKSRLRPQRLPVVPKPVLGWSIASVAAVSLLAMSLEYRNPPAASPSPVVQDASLTPRLGAPPTITVAPAPEPPVEPEPAVVDVEPIPAEKPSRPGAVREKPKDAIARVIAPETAAEEIKPQRAPAPPVAPLAARQELALNSSNPPPAAESVENPSHPPPAQPAPAALPARRQHTIAVHVSVEPRQSSELKRVVSRVPWFGHAVRVEGGTGFSPPHPSRSIEPHVPEFLEQELGREVAVDVRLSIDKYGSVKNAEVLNGPEKSSELAILALNSAGSSSWEPAHQGDRIVPSDVIVHYRFEPRN